LATGSPEPRRLPPLHLVTDDEVLAAKHFVENATAALGAGGPHVALHLRGPNCSGRLIFEIAAALAPVAATTGSLLLVNDRIDVALAAAVDGVQLGRRGMGAEYARSLLGLSRWIGCSVHSPAEAEAVVGAANFLLVGTLFATPSHPGRPGAGPDVLLAVAGSGLPMVGIGGVTAARLPEVRRAGAAGAAVLRAVWQADSPAAAVHELVETWQTSETIPATPWT